MNKKKRKNFSQYFNDSTTDLLKREGFFDPITPFGTSLKKYRFPEKQPKKLKISTMFKKINTI